MKYFKILAGSLLVFLFIFTFISKASGESVTVMKVSGKVEALKVGAQNWTKTNKGDQLFAGDSIKTYKTGNADIGFDSENIVSIKPNTHVVIMINGNEKIELIDGEVFTLVKNIPTGSAFEIRTPTAVCGARGTGNGAKTKKGETTFSAYENDSYAKGINKDGSFTGALIIKQGFKTNIKRFSKPSKLIKLSNRDLDRWGSWKEGFTGKASKFQNKMRGKLIKDLNKIEAHKEKIEERKDDDRIDKRDEGTGSGTSSDNHVITGY